VIRPTMLNGYDLAVCGLDKIVLINPISLSVPINEYFIYNFIFD
jgi:hypothetical protein